MEGFRRAVTTCAHQTMSLWTVREMKFTRKMTLIGCSVELRTQGTMSRLLRALCLPATQQRHLPHHSEIFRRLRKVKVLEAPVWTPKLIMPAPPGAMRHRCHRTRFRCGVKLVPHLHPPLAQATPRYRTSGVAEPVVRASERLLCQQMPLASASQCPGTYCF